MTTATNAMNKRIAIQPAVNRLMEARQTYKKVYNLRDRAARREWQRIAYEPRIDYGEAPQLKPGFHEDNERGWRE